MPPAIRVSRTPLANARRHEASRLHFRSAEAERALILIGVAGPRGSIEPSRRMATTVAGVDGNRGFPVGEAGLRGQRKDRIAAEHLLRRRIAALEGARRRSHRRPIEPANPSADRQPSRWPHRCVGGDVGGFEAVFAPVRFEESAPPKLRRPASDPASGPGCPTPGGSSPAGAARSAPAPSCMRAMRQPPSRR